MGLADLKVWIINVNKIKRLKSGIYVDFFD